MVQPGSNLFKQAQKKSPGKLSTYLPGAWPWPERPVVQNEQLNKHKMQRVVPGESTKNLFSEGLFEPVKEVSIEDNIKDFIKNI